MENKIVKVYVLKGLNGISLVIENYRVSDEKIYGLLTPIYTFDVATDDIFQAIGISTADVIERSKYDNLHNLAKSWLEEKKELEKANDELRSKIDKAIDEIIEKSFISDIYNDRTDDEIIKLDDVLEILKKI